jgi:hypothetical protein
VEVCGRRQSFPMHKVKHKLKASGRPAEGQRGIAVCGARVEFKVVLGWNLRQEPKAGKCKFGGFGGFGGCC